jgi:hypothetical protein
VNSFNAENNLTKKQLDIGMFLIVTAGAGPGR